MHRSAILVALALAGCGAHATASHAAARTPRDQPLACPASSSRAARADRPLELSRGTWVHWGADPGQLITNGRRSTVETHDFVSSRVAACDGHGRLALAWVEDREAEGSRLQLVLGHAPVTLASVGDDNEAEEITGVALAFAPNGELLVVWAEPKRVRAVTVSRADVVGKVVTLGPASDASRLGAEVAANGRAVVAWTTQDDGEERGTPHVIRAVTRARGKLFGRARTIDGHSGVDADQPTDDPRSAIRLAVAPNGRALLLWGTVAGVCCHFTHPLRIAAASATGGFGKFRDIAPQGVPGDVAIRSDGTQLVVWSADDAIHAALGSRVQTFPAPGNKNRTATFAGARAIVGWELENGTPHTQTLTPRRRPRPGGRSHRAGASSLGRED